MRQNWLVHVSSQCLQWSNDLFFENTLGIDYLQRYLLAFLPWISFQEIIPKAHCDCMGTTYFISFKAVVFWPFSYVSLHLEMKREIEMYMEEIGAACILHQFVTGQPRHWNTIISVQILTPFTSSDNTPHTGLTIVVVTIDQLLYSATPGKYIRPTLTQKLFQTMNVQGTKNDNTQHRLLKK